MFAFTFARQISPAMCTKNNVLLWHGIGDSKGKTRMESNELEENSNKLADTTGNGLGPIEFDVERT